MTALSLKKAGAQMKRQIKTLDRENRLLKVAEKRLRVETVKAKAGTEELEKSRITARGVRALRKKLGLSRKELAKLVGVSALSVYLWENKTGALNLREESKLALLELRQIGAREARRRLEGGK